MKISFLSPGGLLLSRYEVRGKKPVAVDLTSAGELVLTADNMWFGVYDRKRKHWVVPEGSQAEIGLIAFDRFTIEG
jgi:hypothetical protein